MLSRSSITAFAAAAMTAAAPTQSLGFMADSQGYMTMGNPVQSKSCTKDGHILRVAYYLAVHQNDLGKHARNPSGFINKYIQQHNQMMAFKSAEITSKQFTEGLGYSEINNGVLTPGTGMHLLASKLDSFNTQFTAENYRLKAEYAYIRVNLNPHNNCKNLDGSTRNIPLPLDPEFTK